MFLTMGKRRIFRHRSLRPFASETAFQRFFEKRLCPKLGLRVVASSLPGHGQLGHMDTLAIDRLGRPVILEYKRDVVGASTIAQIERYWKWVRQNKGAVAGAVARRGAALVPDWRRACIVTVGYRYNKTLKWPSLPGAHFSPLRYGYDPMGGISLVKVSARDATSFGGPDPAPRPSKAPGIRKHLAKTTNAGRRAWESLREVLSRKGFTIHYPGKNRVRFLRDGRIAAEVNFVSTGLMVLFRSSGQADPSGLMGRSRQKSLTRAVGILRPRDVAYAVRLIAG